MNTRSMRLARAAALAATAAWIAGVVSLVWVPPAAADPVGDPTGVVGQGKYGISVGTMRVERQVASSDYTSSGYYMKVQGGLTPRLDFYLKLGSEQLTVPATATSSELSGDRGFALGGGIKLGLPPIPMFGLSSFLDAGVRTFKSGGTVTVVQQGTSPVPVDVENEYEWREYRAAYGVHKAHPVLSPFAGLSATWVDLQVTRSQLSGAQSVSDTGNAFDGPLYGAFLGLNVHISPSTSLVMELSRDQNAGAGFSISLGEVTR